MAAHHHDDDRTRLHELGYAQELRRGLGTFSNFAISFSIISVLAGAITTYWLGMLAGGPLVITTCWVLVGIFALAVGASMGEICSSYPTAGGLYYWSAKLARRNGPRWAWFTGWFNLIGQIGVIASVDFALANFVLFSINMFGDNSKAIIEVNKWNVFITYLVMLTLHGLLNTFGVNLVKALSDVSVWWHVAGVVVIVGALLFADGGQGFGTTFDFRNSTGWSGGISPIYVFLIGLLLAQYTITGFDASAHVSEETIGAATSAPKAIVRSIYISAIAALVMNVVMNAATPAAAYGDISGKGILAGPTLFITALTGTMGKLLVIISTVGQFFCGMASVTANSRMVYAFSRDKGLPASDVWHRINPKTRTPTNSVWLGVVLAAIVGALSLFQSSGVPVAFFAMTGICVVGLYISYIIPVYLKLRNPEFQQGPWNLGTWSKPIGWAAVAWVALVGVVFCMPVFYPVWNKGLNFNFTGPILLGCFALTALWWVASAKNWFTGPKVQGSREELLAIERELEALG
jgi:amino acid transporter